MVSTGRLKFERLQNLCVISVCIWVLSPPLAYSTLARTLSLLAVVVWLLIEALKPRGVVRSPTMPVLLALFFVGYTLLFEVMTHGLAGVVDRIQIYIMLFFLVVQQSRRYNIASLRTVFWLVIVLNVVWMTSTYIFLLGDDARAMRVIVRSTNEARELVEQGVGGYSMAYGAVLLLPVLLAILLRPGIANVLEPPACLRSIPRLPEFLILYSVVISILVVISSQFSIAVLAMFASTAVFFLMWRMTAARALMALFMIVFMVAFGDLVLYEILSLLKPIAEGTNYELKISDTLATLGSDVGQGTAAERLERYSRSIGLFIGNPLTGVMYYTDVGKHSTILDGFARWGILIGGVFVYLLCFLQVRAIRAVGRQSGGAGGALGALLAVLLVFGLNKHFMAAGIIIYLVYPYIFRALEESGGQLNGFRQEVSDA